MTDQTGKKLQEEECRINLKESWDINYWCDELNLKADELKAIVKEVGPLIHDVRLHIAKQHIVKWPVSY